MNCAECSHEIPEGRNELYVYAGRVFCARCGAEEDRVRRLKADHVRAPGPSLTR